MVFLMSILSYICEYGSDSENSDSELEKKDKAKLPVPQLDRVVTIRKETHVDDPQLHNGRIRSFPHVRGNWATFVYIKYPDDVSVLNLIEKIKVAAKSVASIEVTENLHVSLSRTLVLNYHWITSFNSTLKEALQDQSSFYLELDSIKVYCNEENTRTFVSLKVSHFSNKFLMQVLSKVNQVLKEFNLPEFYENPSFHASILWTNGNKQEILETSLKDLIGAPNLFNFEPVLVDKISSKIGNKHYQYCLD